MKQIDPRYRMPAYNTHGTEYIRQLPPPRNQKLIIVSVLCPLLIRFAPQNDVECNNNGIKINQVAVHLAEGIASTTRLKFRFSDLLGLLEMLKQEQILHCKTEDLHKIKQAYFKKLNENV